MCEERRSQRQHDHPQLVDLSAGRISRLHHLSVGAIGAVSQLGYLNAFGREVDCRGSPMAQPTLTA